MGLMGLLKSSSHLGVDEPIFTRVNALELSNFPQFFKMMILCLWCYLTCILMKYRLNLNYFEFELVVNFVV